MSECCPGCDLNPICDYAVCDFCKFYRFNPDADGAYTGDGRCLHPAHPRPADPGDGCGDFDCKMCPQ